MKKQFPTPIKSQYFRDKFQSLADQANQLCEKDLFTARDVAVVVELNQRYIETLDELLETDFFIDLGVVVETEGKTLQFPDIEQAAQWMNSMMDNE